MDGVARLPFHRARDAVANVARVRGTDFVAGQDLHPEEIGLVAVVSCVGVEPVLGLVGVARRVEMRIADHPAERAALVLVDVAGASPPTIFRKVVIAAAAFVQLAAKVQGDGALAVFERADGPQVDRARKSHARNACVGCLVDHDRAHQLRRILVELDGTVEARARLLATVQQNRRKVGRKAANRDDLRASADALRSDAGEPRDRFGDGDVGKLADFLGRDGLDHARRVRRLIWIES